jgi:threonylcarbamoyladenosine tRNA methylthiotransferase MtaB
VRSGFEDGDREGASPGDRGGITLGRPRVAFVTLGCKVNHTESDAVAAELLARGVEISRDPSRADAVVINTCTVTAEADRKARKAVRHALGLPTTPSEIGRAHV